MDYFNRRERNEQSQTTWDTDYNHIFKRIDSRENLTEETLIQLVLTTDPDTRQRQRAVMAASSLAKFAEIEVDLRRYKENYSYLKNSDRILPTEQKIIKQYWSIPNQHWQRAYGLMAAYGVSNHELFHVDLDSLQEQPGHLVSTYRKNHYGIRRIYCLYPEWYEDWKLYKHIDLPQVTGKNNRDLGHRGSTVFRRYGLCKPGDDALRASDKLRRSFDVSPKRQARREPKALPQSLIMGRLQPSFYEASTFRRNGGRLQTASGEARQRESVVGRLQPSFAWRQPPGCVTVGQLERWLLFPIQWQRE